ncbi:MAG: hypothetical protein IPP91_13080 [Betaproteobacteria bacterium]|nr:hypothetical protein [Betaproteobacteria bacterium]
MSRAPRTAIAAAIAAVFVSFGANAVTVAPLPVAPAYGQEVRLYLGTTEVPQYLPANRFVRSGKNIVVDFDYVTENFGPMDPTFGYMGVPIGQLVPGSYTVQARLFDIDLPGTAPQIVRTTFAVTPPPAWGVFLVPFAPGAWEAASVLVHSPANFDSATLRAAVTGNVIRVDFDYASAATASPVSYAGVGIEGLAPGAYRVEAYGRPLSGGAPTQAFALDFTIGTQTPMIEYYQDQLGHYFMAGDPDSVKQLDAGGQGGWQRTGQKFKAWMRQADAPASAHPVCRFYAYGPNSHFYTGNEGECQYLKDVEQSQRADAAAAGKSFLGWGFEGIFFWALMPQNGACTADAVPVFRVYNDRAAQGDSNHRFMLNSALRPTMSDWIDEGVQFCSPR